MIFQVTNHVSRCAPSAIILIFEFSTLLGRRRRLSRCVIRIRTFERRVISSPMTEKCGSKILIN